MVRFMEERTILSRETGTSEYEKVIKRTIDEGPTVQEEVLRKLNKTREILSESEDVQVGMTPNEVLYETRLFRLLHYLSLIHI